MSDVKIVRNSALELYRILVMLLIIAHHYVMNSQLGGLVESSDLSGQSLFYLCFGAWGKIGINCFVLITGYFMCTKSISLKKFLKLYFVVVFYGLMINAVFVLSGYSAFQFGMIFSKVFPFRGLTDGFTPAFLAFYLLIPFLNCLITNISKRQHQMLLLVLLALLSILPCLPGFEISFNYIEWFSVLYLVGAYLRRHPSHWMGDRRLLGYLSAGAFVAEPLSVCLMRMLIVRLGKHVSCYWWVADCNKVTALVVAVLFFLFFNNIKLRYSSVVNAIASTCFGVLIIHANSDIMRRWLWIDVCDNARWYNSPYFALHAIGAVFVVHIVCALVDLLRQKYVEAPLFDWLDRKGII